MNYVLHENSNTGQILYIFHCIRITKIGRLGKNSRFEKADPWDLKYNNGYHKKHITFRLLELKKLEILNRQRSADQQVVGETTASDSRNAAQNIITKGMLS